jgi:hypothetical protein
VGHIVDNSIPSIRASITNGQQSAEQTPLATLLAGSRIERRPALAAAKVLAYVDWRIASTAFEGIQ